MTPNPTITTGILNDTDQEVDTASLVREKLPPRKYVYVWRNIILYIYLHCISLYGVYLAFTSAKFQTLIQVFVLVNLGNIGITCGVHRLWAHRSYKAKTPLKLILVVLQTLAFQMPVIDWARDHRIHHKFSETDADPHNARRGLFFSHVGWLLTKRHPDFKEKGKGVDISDLTSDPILKFQKTYYKYCMPLIAFFLPTVIPMVLWGETFVNAFVLNMLRYCLGLNITWLVNSVAHFYGDKPYDKYINPSENLSVAFLALGEGWHNYHHTFPWDYKTGELGKYGTNMSTAFIDLMGKIGWAYDMKTASRDMILKRVKRTGDGSHLWGWSDTDLSPDERRDTVVINRKDD